MKTFRLVLVALGCLLVQAARAHPLQVEPVIATVHPQKTFITAQFSGNVQDINNAVNILPTERHGDGFAPAAERRLEEYVNGHFKLTVGKTLLPGKLTDAGADSTPDPTKSRFDLVMRYERTGAAAQSGPLTIQNSLFGYLPNAKTVVSIRGVQKTLGPGESATIDPSALAVNLLHNVYDFMMMGMTHIFTGPDHMLFILGLLMVSPTLKSLIKTLTGFTIAHSITLALSALNIVVIDGRVCDIFIALSIIYIGVENFIVKTVKHRFWVATSFGLVHGFGFSSALREVGLPHEGLAWCLLSFNLGVEIAQIILCSLAFPLLMLWRRDVEKRAQYGGLNWPAVIRVASVWVVFMGGYWLVQRVTG